MSIYKCNSCPINCKVEIPDECDFYPSEKVCIAELDYAEPCWDKVYIIENINLPERKTVICPKCKQKIETRDDSKVKCCGVEL